MADSKHDDVEQLWTALESSRERLCKHDDEGTRAKLGLQYDGSGRLNCGYEQSAIKLQPGRLLQILRKWRARSRKHASEVKACTGSAARSGSRSPLQSISLKSCTSMNAQLLCSDGEDDDEGNDEKTSAAKRKSSRSPTTQQLSPRTLLSCSKLGSPLSACTPFSSINFDEHMKCEEELERLRPDSPTLDGSASRRKGSSPLKLNLSRQPSTPKGYVAMYVGEERKRFLVKASALNHPLVLLLLEKAREEFGFPQKGPLTIPCNVEFFRQIMLLVKSNDPFYRNADPAAILLMCKIHEELSSSLPDEKMKAAVRSVMKPDLAGNAKFKLSAGAQ